MRGGEAPARIEKYNINIYIWRPKKMYKLPERWGGGEGNLGNARKKTFFFKGGVPLAWTLRRWWNCFCDTKLRSYQSSHLVEMFRSTWNCHHLFFRFLLENHLALMMEVMSGVKGVPTLEDESDWRLFLEGQALSAGGVGHSLEFVEIF